MTWWTGTRLVAARSLRETFRSKSWRVVTGLLLLLSVAGVVLPQLFDDGPPTHTLVTIEPASADLRASLVAAGREGGFEVDFRTVDSRAAARQSVADGDASAALVGDTLFTSADVDTTFPVLVAQTRVAQDTTRLLRDAGLTPGQLAGLADVRPPKQVSVGPVDDADRAGVGFAVGVVLYLALIFAGVAIANAVASEKSSRISEVLLAVLRPSQILVGTVAAVGLATLAQLLTLALPLAVAVRVTPALGLPPVAAGDLMLAVVWFAVGFAVYAFVFAAAGALVDKVSEVGTATIPVNTALIAAYLLGVTVVADDPGSRWSMVLSVFPLSAPIVMPIRWAAGVVPVSQLGMALVLSAATSVLLAAAASVIYGRALLVTGRRVRLRETWSRPRGRSGRLTGASH